MDSAYLKFAAFKEIGDDKDNFSTPYISVFVASLVLSFFIILSKNYCELQKFFKDNSIKIPQKFPLNFAEQLAII